jgi:RNA-binding protein 23/39
MRSVFVSQLSARVGDRELGQFFDANAGKVREARVITDRISRRSKGFVCSLSILYPFLTVDCLLYSVGYVEFHELESVPKALGLSGTNLLGIPVRVEYTEAEKNRQAATGESRM